LAARSALGLGTQCCRRSFDHAPGRLPASKAGRPSGQGVRAGARLEYLLLPGPAEHSAFSPPRAEPSAMDPVYGIPLIAALVLAWLAARHVINKARQQRELLRRQRGRSRRKYHHFPANTR